MDFHGLLQQIKLDQQAAFAALLDERERDFRVAVQRLASHAQLLADDVKAM